MSHPYLWRCQGPPGAASVSRKRAMALCTSLSPTWLSTVSRKAGEKGWPWGCQVGTLPGGTGTQGTQERRGEGGGQHHPAAADPPSPLPPDSLRSRQRT